MTTVNLKSTQTPFQTIFNDVVVKTIQDAYAFIVKCMPQFLVAVVVFLVGLSCAIIIRKVIAKLLKVLGFDVFAERIGLKKFLEKGGYDRNPSSMVGFCFYLIIVFSTIVMVLNTMQLKVASKFLEHAALYVPKVIVALVLLSLGAYLSKFIGKFVKTTLRLANIPLYEALGISASYVVMGLTVMIALEQIGVVKTITSKSFFIVLCVIPAIFFVMFLIGGKEIMANIVSDISSEKDIKKVRILR